MWKNVFYFAQISFVGTTLWRFLSQKFQKSSRLREFKEIIIRKKSIPKYMILIADAIEHAKERTSEKEKIM